MREAIEKAIAELKQEVLICRVSYNATKDEWYKGRIYEAGYAMKLLRQVLANGENDSRRIPETDGQAQEQIPGGKDDGW